MIEPTDEQIAMEMITHGHPFEEQLGKLFMTANPTNREKIKTIWPNRWLAYKELIQSKALVQEGMNRALKGE